MLKKTAMSILLAISLTSCCTPSVSAERAVFDEITPAYTAYVQADPLLDDAMKNRRYRFLTSWKMRLDASAKANGGK
jgi:predicted lipoprotein